MIIGKFGEELVPHAATLVQKLCEAFLAYAAAAGGEGGDEGEGEETAMAACQCVEAITTVLSTILESAEAQVAVYLQCRPFLLQV